MKTLKQEMITKDYLENGICIKKRLIYYYDTEEEREDHIAEMRDKGYLHTGQVIKSCNLFNSADYVWYAEYYKISEERRNGENV